MRNIRKDSQPIRGRAVTSQRQLLLSLIKRARGHISAKELYAWAVRKNKSISLATVYRNLRLFKELGLIEERRLGEGTWCYEMKESPGHQHLVCKGCGRVIEFDSPLLRKLVDKLQQEHDFKLTKIELYMEGYCHECHMETMYMEK